MEKVLWILENLGSSCLTVANEKPPWAPKGGPILSNTQANSGFKVACLGGRVGLFLGSLVGLLELVGLGWAGLISLCGYNPFWQALT